jgi:hypothetical protein
MPARAASRLDPVVDRPPQPGQHLVPRLDRVQVDVALWFVRLT